MHVLEEKSGREGGPKNLCTQNCQINFSFCKIRKKFPHHKSGCGGRGVPPSSYWSPAVLIQGGGGDFAPGLFCTIKFYCLRQGTYLEEGEKLNFEKIFS